MRFTFQTVERIKGNAPQTFTLAGAPIHHLKEADEYAALVHNGMGEFWSEFRAGCYSAPLAYAVDRNFLIFADAKGKVLLLYYRGSELLSTPTDHWLDAVRALSRDPSLKKGRRARLVDFLTSAKAILVSRTTSCDRLSRNQDTRQIWGTVLTDAEIDHLFTTQRRSACEPGRRQLTVVFADGYGSDVSFDVSGEQDTVDFTGFIDGTEQGIAFETRRATDVTGVLWPVWYSQIDLEGPRVWRLADIEATLKTAAQSKH